MLLAACASRQLKVPLLQPTGSADLHGTEVTAFGQMQHTNAAQPWLNQNPSSALHHCLCHAVQGVGVALFENRDDAMAAVAALTGRRVDGRQLELTLLSEDNHISFDTRQVSGQVQHMHRFFIKFFG